MTSILIIIRATRQYWSLCWLASSQLCCHDVLHPFSHPSIHSLIHPSIHLLIHPSIHCTGVAWDFVYTGPYGVLANQLLKMHCIYSICQLTWCKHSYQGQFQATKSFKKSHWQNWPAKSSLLLPHFFKSTCGKDNFSPQLMALKQLQKAGNECGCVPTAFYLQPQVSTGFGGWATVCYLCSQKC